MGNGDRHVLHQDLDQPIDVVRAKNRRPSPIRCPYLPLNSGFRF